MFYPKMDISSELHFFKEDFELAADAFNEYLSIKNAKMSHGIDDSCMSIGM